MRTQINLETAERSELITFAIQNAISYTAKTDTKRLRKLCLAHQGGKSEAERIAQDTTKSKSDRFRELYALGLTIPQIKKLTGCCYSQIHNVLVYGPKKKAENKAVKPQAASNDPGDGEPTDEEKFCDEVETTAELAYLKSAFYETMELSTEAETYFRFGNGSKGYSCCEPEM